MHHGRHDDVFQIPHAAGDGPATGLAAHSAFPMSATPNSSGGVEFLVFGGTCGHDPSYQGEGWRDLMVNSLWRCDVKLPLEVGAQERPKTVVQEEEKPEPVRINAM